MKNFTNQSAVKAIASRLTQRAGNKEPMWLNTLVPFVKKLSSTAKLVKSNAASEEDFNDEDYSDDYAVWVIGDSLVLSSGKSGVISTDSIAGLYKQLQLQNLDMEIASVKGKLHVLIGSDIELHPINELV